MQFSKFYMKKNNFMKTFAYFVFIYQHCFEWKECIFKEHPNNGA